ncbi:hypothetical protein [Sphingobacterium faecale]|uniref:Uncharacterized protein n=1 Tax=Sphingobacterium faecale TaxID=2803775 RepID=A0ABS1RBG8_9SPHI|nr:hypothetical protein [Sphingobacterium faecale]MBL1411191.1 hypothetical protein [Sphingobacterium faecale]
MRAAILLLFLSISFPPSASIDRVDSTTRRPCYPGAYYRKVVSDLDHWTGITGRVRLPVIEFDKNRVNTNKPGQFLDNPTVYMGGNMDGQETDIGLTWEVIKESDGTISKERKAYRPFFRRNAYGKSKQKFTWISGPPEPQYYWYPGDVISITVKIIRDGVLKFTVEGEGKKYETEVACDAYIFGRAGEFKRVNAIDQVGNENKPVQPTNTKVIKSEWAYTYLLKMENGKEIKRSLNTGRHIEMSCPQIEHFPLQQHHRLNKKGGESIDIYGRFPIP